ncbi:hypothetical protein [Lacinutrix salivirga]
MKYVLYIILFASLLSIILGYTLEANYSQKLIGFGVLAIFFVLFPLFIYHRSKGKKMKDYMLTQENLDKMRKREGDKRSKQ